MRDERIIDAFHASRIDSECLYRDAQYRSGAWERVPRVALVRGTAAHSARAWALTRYIEDRELPPLEPCIQTAIDAAETRNEKDAAHGTGLSAEDLTKAIDAALPLVRTDYTLILPQIAPHVRAVEETLEVDLGDGIRLTGTLDARGVDPMTGVGLLPDLKTAEKSPGPQAQDRADFSTQLSLYAALHQHHFGSIPVTALQYVWTMARGPKAATIERDRIQVCDLGDGVGCARTITTQRAQWDVRAALQLIRFRVDADEAGWAPPHTGNYMPACLRCPHWAHVDETQRCIYRTSQRRENT